MVLARVVGGGAGRQTRGRGSGSILVMEGYTHTRGWHNLYLDHRYHDKEGKGNRRGGEKG